MTPYCAALQRLFALSRFGEKLDLSGPRALNAALGDPLARAGRAVLIGGTNGKGSTCAFLAAVLQAAGLRVGLFTSPHLVRFSERVLIDGAPIDDAQVVSLTARVLDVADAAGLRPSFFEAVFGMAACAFAEAGVDVVIWEVGLGGRLDATNVVDPEVSAVVSVGLDHVETLGGTLSAIAREKAGILRAGRPALSVGRVDGQPDAGLDALRAAWPPLEVVAVREALPPLPLAGEHQRANASLALAVARALGVDADPAALSAAVWPGRLERLGGVLLDCAHNPPAAAALRAWIDAALPRPRHLVFGAMADKDVGTVASVLGPAFETVTVVTVDTPRRMAAEALALAFAGHPGLRVGAGVAEALAARPADAETVVTGSCFLVGEARAHLTGQPWPECGLRTTAR